MTTEELKNLLESKQWSQDMRQQLVSEWNKRRDDVLEIGINHVRTPCRLRQIVSAFKLFLSNNSS